jgi:hypothetical protein
MGIWALSLQQMCYPPHAWHTGIWRSTVKKIIIGSLLLECQWHVFRSAQRC